MKFVLILFTLVFVSPFAFEESFSDEIDLFCEDGKILVYRVNADKFACLNPPTAEKWYKLGIAEPVEQIKSFEKMTLAPVPDSARGPAIDPEKGYYVEEISDGLYFLTEGVYQVMFLTTGQGVIVVDAPPSIGEKILLAISEVTDEPITYLVYSHTHTDHIGAASMFKDVTIIAHEETAQQLERNQDPNRPIPDVIFSDSYTLEVGNQTLQLDYKGPAHEPGNIYIYAPQQKVLMIVDVIFPGWSPFKGLAEAEDRPAFFEAHDKILEYDFDVLISGHLGRYGTSEDVTIQKEYMNDIKTNAGIALQTVDFMAIAQEVGFDNPWYLFDVYLDEVVQKCTDMTEPEWIDRLAAVDVFTEDHCFEVIMSLRID